MTQEEMRAELLSLGIELSPDEEITPETFEELTNGKGDDE